MPRPEPTLKPTDFTDASRGVRIQKALAAAGVASRRHCEDLVREGRIRVNGQQVTELPAWVDPFNDRIEVNGTVLARARRPGKRARQAPPPGAPPSPPGAAPAEASRGSGSESFPGGQGGRLYVMVNKPRRVVSTAHDPEGRQTVTDLVQLEGVSGPVRLFPVGRLDADSTGLMLLTNDGELANRLTHPRYHVAKTYLVSIKGAVTPEDVARLEKGLFLADRGHPRGGPIIRTPGLRSVKSSHHPATTGIPGAGARAGPGARIKRAAVEQALVVDRRRDQSRGDRSSLRVTLSEGQNREIRRLMARLGFKVRRLQRIAIGPLRLKGLVSGNWRFLTRDEVKALRLAAGL